MPYRICSLRAGNLSGPSRAAQKTQPRHQTLSKDLMLEEANGHTRSQCATCPLWMAMVRLYGRQGGVNSYFVGIVERLLCLRRAAAWVMECRISCLLPIQYRLNRVGTTGESKKLESAGASGRGGRNLLSQLALGPAARGESVQGFSSSQDVPSGSVERTRPFSSLPGSLGRGVRPELVAISSRRNTPTRIIPTIGAARRNVSQPD